MPAMIRDVPASVKATGKPSMRTPTTPKNMATLSASPIMMLSTGSGPFHVFGRAFRGRQIARGQQGLVAGQDQDAARRDREALEPDKDGECDQAALDDVESMHAADILRPLLKEPGTDHITPAPIDEDGYERQQKQQDAEEIEPSLVALAGWTVEDIDSDVMVMQQGIPGPQRKRDGMEPDIDVLHPDEADVEDVTQHHDGEADQHDAERQPRDRTPDPLVELVDDAHEKSQRRHAHPPLV